MSAPSRTPKAALAPDNGWETDGNFTVFWNLRLKYSKLDFARFETRCLKILPSEAERPGVLQLELSTAFYEPATLTIAVDGVEVPVTQNLHAALHQLRQKGEDICWVDALCINQADSYERGQQVLRMGQIYSAANKVVAWLGADTPGSRRVMKRIASFSTSSQAGINTEHLSFDDKYLIDFFTRPYFSRMWIIPEIAKAQAVEAWCGPDSVSFDDLCRFCPPGLEVISAIDNFRTRERQSRIGVARTLLAEAMLRSRHTKATDARDKVYALLGLTLDGSDLVPWPIYKEPADRVLKEVTSKMVAQEGLSSVVLLARGSNTAKISWQPTWGGFQKPIPPWVAGCISRARESLLFSTTVHQDHLQVSGILISSIEDVGKHPSAAPPVYFRRDRNNHLKPWQPSLKAKDILSDVFDALVAPRSHASGAPSDQSPNLPVKATALAMLIASCSTPSRVSGLSSAYRESWAYIMERSAAVMHWVLSSGGLQLGKEGLNRIRNAAYMESQEEPVEGT